MSDQAQPNFKQALKKNLKRILAFWVLIAVLLGGLGTLLGIYTISNYTTAIGRPDLMAAALSAKSDLVTWLVIVALVVTAYFLVLMTTGILFGLAVSLFNECPSLQSDIVKLLLLPVFLGIAVLMALVFKVQQLDDLGRFGFLISFVVITVWSLHLSPKFRLAVDLCATAATPGKANSKGSRIFLLVMLMFVLVSAVFSAVLPVSLILKGYTGEDSPEAITKLMFISIFSAALPLMPALVFYVSRADLFKRVAQCLALALLILPIVIGISPGGSQSIVYSSASLMKVRDQSEAKFLLTEIYAADDFSSDIWGAVESVRNQPLISAFPLFSFGDVLLLCPIKLIKTKLKDWPAESAYCVTTKGGKAIRMPRKPEASKNTA